MLSFGFGAQLDFQLIRVFPSHGIGTRTSLSTTTQDMVTVGVCLCLMSSSGFLPSSHLVRWLNTLHRDFRGNMKPNTPANHPAAANPAMTSRCRAEDQRRRFA